jgi:Na+-translocating ferredoxin:NAD+ oxidoreductase RnfC subunit
MPQKLSKDHIYSESKGKVKGNYRLDEDHLLPSKLQRYKRGESFAERARSTLFNQADDVLDEVYCDICNGVARSDIVQKLMKTQYESQSGQQKNMTYRTANEYYNCALDRMHFNTDIEHARLKDIFYNRYESLLETAIKKGDVFNAKGVLDSMAKIFLGMDKQQNNIQINNNKDGITIHFGFQTNNEESDIEDAEEIKDDNLEN